VSNLFFDYEQEKIRTHNIKNKVKVKGKVKVKLSLCLTKHYTMETYWGLEVKLHTFLSSALDGGEW
jgi:hypothetical protein